ncbi:E3 ubiquitin-protein ligase rnf8-B [Amphibalanus amphitrite]|uniref:E3 ubiquitin-protein ligase rnf8-B n=1 Tax=Amphibalanus amphitrite TaxID=1232801 RepID=A0A6A4XDH8_AMPAM|nr:E3 ubiquitin-protein ligase rnf8-B [Amphibalanus amphitrite]
MGHMKPNSAEPLDAEDQARRRRRAAASSDDDRLAAFARDLSDSWYSDLPPKLDAGGVSTSNANKKSTFIRLFSHRELECAVCLELFRRATTLGCGHTFCADCVRSTRRCPLCRAPVTSAARSVTLDSIIGSLSAAQGADGVTGALYPELGHTGPH